MPRKSRFEIPSTASQNAIVFNSKKCDGKLPACTACEKSGRAGECSSANDQFAKGKERRSVEVLSLTPLLQTNLSQLCCFP